MGRWVANHCWKKSVYIIDCNYKAQSIYCVIASFVYRATATNIRGSSTINERGYYTVDTLRLVVAVDDINRLLPAMISDPTAHIKDRLIFQNTVFTPTRVNPRGRYKERYSVVTIDCNQVNAEELVNDPQFQQYAE